MAEVSPEMLAKLADLIKAAASSSRHDPTWLEKLKGVSEFLNAVAWPVAFTACALLFRRQLTSFIEGIDSFKLFGAEISRKISKKIEESGVDAGSKVGLSSAPSAGELSRAVEIEGLAIGVGLSAIRQQAEELAAEYARVRHTMFPGDPRTRRMEVVVAKMRTLAKAFYPLRNEFAKSADPGKRLMAIAALQVDPDFDMLDWLASRLSEEKPFVGYHAVVALLLAVRSPNAAAYLPSIKTAVENLRKTKATLAKDTDRLRTLEQVEAAAAALDDAAKDPIKPDR